MRCQIIGLALLGLLIGCGEQGGSSPTPSCDDIQDDISRAVREAAADADDTCQTDADCTIVTLQVVRNEEECHFSCSDAFSLSGAASLETFFTTDPQLDELCLEQSTRMCTRAVPGCAFVRAVCREGICEDLLDI